MKLIRILIAIFIFISTVANSQTIQPETVYTSSDTLKIMSWNIRILTKADTGLIYWNNRKNEVAALIRRYQPDILGVQEIRNMRQQKDLLQRLSDYASISYGRDNNRGSRGERLAILYNKKRFSHSENGFFFLSATPEKVSAGWDAVYNRICVWCKLTDNATNKTFYVFNTHFDHVGKIAREKSAKLITEKINEIAGNFPVVLTGDFNATPADKNFYSNLKKTFIDSRESSRNEPVGTTGTFNGWNFSKSDFSESVRIDYIFVNKMRVLNYSTINDKTNAGIYPSDHFPVIINTIID
jgi:endonuclease/exonuclease/phosphatase family metal-dependent hydrolase